MNETYSDDETDGRILSELSGQKNRSLAIKKVEEKKEIKFISYDFDGLLHG